MDDRDACDRVWKSGSAISRMGEGDGGGRTASPPPRGAPHLLTPKNARTPQMKEISSGWGRRGMGLD